MFWQLTKLLPNPFSRIACIMYSHKHTNCTTHLLLPINKDPCSLHSSGEIESSQPLKVPPPLICILPSYLNGQIIGGNIRVLGSPVKSQAVCHLEALARKAIMFNDTHTVDTALALSFCPLMRCSSLCVDEGASGRMFWVKCLSQLWLGSLQKVQH